MCNPENSQAVGTTVTIEVDPNIPSDYDDDSGISDDGSSFTTSLASSLLKYRQENGRSYHAYREGKYAIPNDETENDRLDLQHALFTMTLGGKLHLAPLGTVHNCLDLGTGTGIWAIDYADEHPESQVTGVDLSPIQPQTVPPNVKFIVDDVEDVWVYPENHFDYIHSRLMIGSVQDWDKLLENCHRHLRPGGWVELQDAYMIDCDDDTLKPDSPLRQWFQLIKEGFVKIERDMYVANKHKQRLLDAGFTDVVETVYKWPTNSWPKDKTLKEMGLWSRENMSQALEALSLAVLTRALGWTLEEVKVLNAKAKADLVNPRIHAYVPVYFVYGRKPE